jgi:hypothetical protein
MDQERDKLEEPKPVEIISLVVPAADQQPLAMTWVDLQAMTPVAGTPYSVFTQHSGYHGAANSESLT